MPSYIDSVRWERADGEQPIRSGMVYHYKQTTTFSRFGPVEDLRRVLHQSIQAAHAQGMAASPGLSLSVVELRGPYPTATPGEFVVEWVTASSSADQAQSPAAAITIKWIATIVITAAAMAFIASEAWHKIRSDTLIREKDKAIADIEVEARRAYCEKYPERCQPPPAIRESLGAIVLIGVAVAAGLVLWPMYEKSRSVSRAIRGGATKGVRAASDDGF